MQEIDTWTSAGWRNADDFAHYVQAKQMMKESMDAAHARGMILRPVPNSILRLAQMPESLLEARLATALPAAGPARKAAERSQQRDALALLVRRVTKRTLQVNATEAQHVDGSANAPSPATVQMYTQGSMSTLCMNKLRNSDLNAKGILEHAKNQQLNLADNWENAPYWLSRNNHQQAGHEHSVGIQPHYLENLLLPGKHALRKDLNAIMAFTSSTDGKDFIPVGLVVYGTCRSTAESARHEAGSDDNQPEHRQRFKPDFIHFLPKQADNEGSIPESNLLLRGQVAAGAFGSSLNAENARSYANYGVFYNQYATAPNNLQPSEMQNRVYDERVAEIYAMCAQDPMDTEFQKRKDEAKRLLLQQNPNALLAQIDAAIAAVPRPQQRLQGWGSLLMAFSLSFMATERISQKNGNLKRWIPKYAGVVMELAPDTELVEEAPAASKQLAKRGTQMLRGISKRMGFTSQPLLRTPRSFAGGVNNFEIPDFAGSWGIERNDYVSLYRPGRDFFELTKIGESLPKDIKAENSAVLGSVLNPRFGMCPSIRGSGIVKCS